MAHPYSSTPYAGAPSYAPQQQSYYPQYSSNGLQQQMQTLQSPGLPQQPAQGQGQLQTFPTFQQPPSTPSGNGAPFEQNTQAPPPGLSFPPFPPTLNFNSDFFKQIASAGFPPPPPPPNIPPMTIPTPGYPQLQTPVNSSSSSAYLQYHTAGPPQGFGPGYAQTEQLGQQAGNQYVAPQQGTQVGAEWQRETQTYGAPGAGQSGSSHNPRPVSRGVISLMNDKDQSLPSFGSRSDLDMLFATAQTQGAQVVPLQKAAILHDSDDNDTTDYVPAIDGGASPYDPTRPATITDRPLGGFGPSSGASKSAASKKMERTYDNKSHTELRQLAKGAVLSLVPHKILYADLVKEGVNSQILRELYEELGLKIEPEQAHTAVDEPVQQHVPVVGAHLATIGQQSGTKSHEDTLKSADVSAASAPSAAPTTATATQRVATESASLPALLDGRKQQPAPSSSLERKDRIAQLLAAKAGRPTPPTTAASAQSEETLATVPATKPPNATEITPMSSTSQVPSVSQADAIAPPTIGINKSKAQTELVKQKMEQLRREAQARTEASGSQPFRAQPGTLDRTEATDDSKPIPQFKADTPLSTSKMSSSANQPALTSMIPGLFMGSMESSGLDGLASDSSPFQGVLASTVPAKHPLESSFSSGLSQQPSKKPKTQQFPQADLSVATQDNDMDYPSEGEVIDELEADAMALDQQSEQSLQQEYQPSAIRAPPPIYSNRPADIEQTSTISPQNMSSTGSGSDQLYRAKQSEIESMRRKIAEMEQRNKLKRSKSQIESPASSKAATPPVIAEDQQLSSSPVATHSDLSGPRQIVGSRTTSKLTREQLQERAAMLKADLLRQRAQRQQVLQEGLPDLNDEVKKTETRLDHSRKELAKVRAQIQDLRAKLDQLAAQEKELDGEVALFKQQLIAGREGQQQYTIELQEIKLQKLAEEEAPPQQEPETTLTAQQTTSTGLQVLPELNNGDLAAEDMTYQDGQPLGDRPVDSTSASYLADEDGDTEMQVEDDDESATAYQAENRLPENTESTPVFDADTEQEQDARVDDVEEFAITQFEASAVEGPRSTDAQLQAALDDQLGAGEMEISPEPEIYEESHESLPAPLVKAQESTEEAMNRNDDSDGSASMSGSDEEEEEYEPAEADASVPMQQSDDEEEYDPEAAPVESGTPISAVENGKDNYQGLPVHTNATEAVTIASDGELSVNGVSAAVSDAVISPADVEAALDEVAAVSEVPANTQDDLETRGQLTEADFMTRPPPGQGRDADTVPLLDGSSTPTTHYVPYKTPFSSFKSYRFHPDFNDTVKSGYRSLTYSNNIDPTRPLCPTELSGQVCQDQSCEEQHFSQLGLPDEKILVQMSSASDIKDKTLKEEFHAGLKGVIAELRANGVKDFEKVADALSKYRRDFFTGKEDYVALGGGEEGPEAVEIVAGVDEQLMDTS